MIAVTPLRRWIPIVLWLALTAPATAAGLAVDVGVNAGGHGESVADDEAVDFGAGTAFGLEAVFDYDATGEVFLRLGYERFEASGDDFDNTDVGLVRIGFGGRRYFEDTAGWTPFAAADVAVHRLAADGYDDEWLPGIGLYGGVSRKLSDNWRLRLNLSARGIVTDSSGELLCQQGRCLLRVNGQGWWRMGVAVGLQHRF